MDEYDDYMYDKTYIVGEDGEWEQMMYYSNMDILQYEDYQYGTEFEDYIPEDEGY